MKNSDMPAMPIEINGFGQYAPEVYGGLTKREMFAMNAMQGLLSCSDNELLMNIKSMKDWYNSHSKAISVLSVQYADALLKELDK